MQSLGHETLHHGAFHDRRRCPSTATSMCCGLGLVGVADHAEQAVACGYAVDGEAAH